MKAIFKNSLFRYIGIRQLPALVCFIITGSNVYGQGATVPFKTLEAESGNTAGGAAVHAMTTMPAAPTPELEASGRAYVALNGTGQSISWINNTGITANTIVIRASIPDAPTGGGIDATLNLYVNGVFRQALSLTSRNSWVYGTLTDWADNNPASALPHRYYDEARAFITGAAIAPGSTIMLKKDSTNTASFYHIDLIDLENAGPALPQPANTLSVVDYGATPNDSTDDTNPIKACIAACQSQGKGMWIPPGTFRTGTRISATGISIYGAGMWYTTLYRIIGAPHAWDLTNCNVSDLYIDNPEVGRTVAMGHDYGILMKGANGWLIQRVWVHGGGACFWLSGTDGTIRDCRTGNSWADGINLNNGPVVDANKLGLRLTCQNNYVRGSTDDGIAINAQNGAYISGNMVDTKVLNNSSVATIYANGIRVAGGRNSVVQNNLVTDPADNSGIKVGRFGTAGNPCESVLVSKNEIWRGSGYRGVNAGISVTDTAVATVSNNVIINSHNVGILINTSNATFTANTVVHPALQGFRIAANVIGSATINYNTVADLNAGQLAYQKLAGTAFTASLTGNSWQSAATDVTFYQHVNYGGAAGQVLPVGNYTAAQLAAKDIPDEWASSVRVPNGKKVIMYAGDNFTGNSWTITYDTPDFTTLSPNANDQLSSCKVQTDSLSMLAAPGNLQVAKETTIHTTDPAATISVYPNPVDNTLFITGAKQAATVVVSNTTGQVVLTTTMTGNSIDVSRLTPGLYFITVGNRKSTRFIKK